MKTSFKGRDHQDSENRYKAIFDSGMVGVVISDPNGRIWDANNYFIEMLGYSQKELEQGELNWLQMTAPEDVEKSKDAAQLLSEKKRIQCFEKHYLHKDGSRVPVLVTATFYEDRSIIAIVLDISNLKKVERDLEEIKLVLEQRVEDRTRELRQSQQFFEAVFENMPNMVFVKEAKDLRFVRFNRAGEELIGVPRSQMIGKNDYDYFPKEQADFFTLKDREVLMKKQVLDIPEEPLQSGRGLRYLHTKKIPILNQEGNPEYLLGLSEDITEKKETEKQKLSLLQEQVARESAEARARQMSFLSDVSLTLTESFDLKRILKSFTDKAVLFMVDICSVNLLNEDGTDIEARELSCHDAQDMERLKGMQKYSLRWDATRGPVRVLRTGESELYKNFDLEAFIKEVMGDEAARDRAPYSISVMMFVPIKLRYQKTIGYASFVLKEDSELGEDIDMSLAEEICRRLATAIENSRLYFKIQEVSRAKSDFLANISHEIRTPLGAILGFTELLLENGFIENDRKKTIETILRNGQHLLGIVNEILDISKIESDKVHIEKIDFSLQDLLRDVIGLMRQKAKSKGIELCFSSQDLPVRIKSDPTRLRQILMNIIENAIKFTDKGKVEVEVVRKEQGKEQSHLEFRIRDTGIGIKPDQIGKLFQSFSQADSSMTRRFGGTGLGLVLARKLARLLGGDVMLEKSAQNEGSLFLVTIAYQNAESVMPSVSAAQSLRRLPDQTDSGFENIQKILLVDDALDNRVLFQRYLVKLGVSPEKIDMAENGQEALTKALKNKYTLILLDIQMPIMDGFQTLDELRNSHYSGPIVALTAHAMKGYKQACLTAGFDDYLQKPLSREALKNLLNKVQNSLQSP